MRINTLTILFLFIYSTVSAQDFPVGIDSIDNKLRTLKSDTGKIKYLNKISDWKINKLEIIPYLLVALKKAENLKSDTLLAATNSNLATVYYLNDNFIESIFYRNKSEIHYRNIANYKKLRQSYRDKSRSYFYLGQYDFAIYEIKKSLQLLKKAPDNKFQSLLYREVGISYIRLNQTDTAFYYYQKALKISLEYNLKINNLYNYSEIGKYYYEKGDNIKAIKYQKKALKSVGGKANTFNTSLPFLRLSQAYLNVNQIDSSLVYGKLCVKALHLNSRLSAYRVIAKIYLKKNEFSKAISYIDSSNMVSLKMKNFTLLNKDYEIYSEIYKKIGNKKMQLLYKELQLANYDSIIIQTNNQKLKNIKILSDIDEFEASNNLLMEEKKQDEIKFYISKIFNIASGIIIFLGLIIILGVFYILRKIKIKSTIILEQKNEILTQNEEITAQNEVLYENNEELTSTLDKLKQTQMQLVQSEKMASLGVLTAGIAHEINNPVNFIYTGVNSLQKDLDDIDIVLKKVEKLSPETENLKDEIQKIQNLKEEYYFSDAYGAISETILDIKIGSERTSEIVKGLRNFSRADKGEWIQADIHKGIEASLLMLKSKYKNRINIVQDYDKSLPKIECLPGKLNQALLNILNNAIDAISEKGVIKIRTKTAKSYIFVYIKDNGSGISDEAKEHIFEPFYTSKDVGKGVGLGLSITYGIIKDHNGDIMVESEPEKGTEFIIKLPIKQIIE